MSRTTSPTPIPHTLSQASRLIYGCMGFGGGWNSQPVRPEHIHQANVVVDTALECGIRTFDHADIYTFGKAEQVFGDVLKQRPHLRDQMVIQTKCGIRFETANAPKRYDLSGQWITHSVEQSLNRLHCDYIDVLMLHRPDPLMQPEEIAEAYRKLKKSGKVRHLGVSNMHQHQMEELQSALDEPLVANQIEMSLQKLGWLNEGIYTGSSNPGTPSSNHHCTPGLLQYCKKHNVQLQAWGALCQGLFSQNIHTHETTEHSASILQTSKKVAHLAERHSTTTEAIVLAWLMYHPAQIKPVIGTTTPNRIRACAKAADVSLTREEWYTLYTSALGDEVP